MKVFISWSGPRSQAMAEALRDWLPNVIQAVEPWTSSSDIDAGARWTPALAEQLQQTQLGIICLTAENLSAPWVLFEAGALSKIIDKMRVCPYLLALEPTEVTGPLAQFQAVKADKDGTKRLLQTINRALGELALPEERLYKIFELLWPSLEKILLDIPISPQGTPKPKRSLDDMVEEILRIVREQSTTRSVNPLIHKDNLGVFKEMRLIESPEGGWDIKRPHSKRVLGHTNTRVEAIDFAHKICINEGADSCIILETAEKDQSLNNFDNEPCPMKDMKK